MSKLRVLVMAAIMALIVAALAVPAFADAVGKVPCANINPSYSHPDNDALDYDTADPESVLNVKPCGEILEQYGDASSAI